MNGSGGVLFAGGLFTSTRDGNITLNHVARWAGGVWSPLGDGLSSTVYALAVSGSKLYAGGAFTTTASGVANCPSAHCYVRRGH